MAKHSLVIEIYFLLQSPDLQGALDVCIDYVQSNGTTVNLQGSSASTSRLQRGCPDMQCQVASSLTIGDGGYVEFTLAEMISFTEYMNIRLTFQTR